MKDILVVVVIIGILILLGLWYYSDKNINNFITEYSHQPIKYEGLVLFDIDGTLTDGTENQKVVDYFLKKNYAVGISTAGRGYHKKNLHTFNWMPPNLYNFMIQNNFDTFNNVSDNVLCGQWDPQTYIDYNRTDISFLEQLGWRKGLTLKKTGEKYGITDPQKLYLIDNDPSYIMGLKMFNPHYNIICAGLPCSNQVLSLNSIIPQINL